MALTTNQVYAAKIDMLATKLSGYYGARITHDTADEIGDFYANLRRERGRDLLRDAGLADAHIDDELALGAGITFASVQKSALAAGQGAPASVIEHLSREAHMDVVALSVLLQDKGVAPQNNVNTAVFRAVEFDWPHGRGPLPTETLLTVLTLGDLPQPLPLGSSDPQIEAHRRHMANILAFAAMNAEREDHDHGNVDVWLAQTNDAARTRIGLSAHKIAHTAMPDAAFNEEGLAWVTSAYGDSLVAARYLQMGDSERARNAHLEQSILHRGKQMGPRLQAIYAPAQLAALADAMLEHVLAASDATDEKAVDAIRSFVLRAVGAPTDGGAPAAKTVAPATDKAGKAKQKKKAQGKARRASRPKKGPKKPSGGNGQKPH